MENVDERGHDQGPMEAVARQVEVALGQVTDDDLTTASGSTEYLAGRIQERYGIARDEAEKQIRDFDARL
jgi:uncharacterized protein YjbJ (UPF0337 family)